MEEIKGMTWDLWGEELSHEQSIQRIVNAGFPIKGGVALIMFAIVEGESGEYQKAWHANVQRNEDGTIYRSEGMMTVKSIDLGFMQFNVEISPDVRVEMTTEAMTNFVEAMFADHPDLANPVASAERAYELWTRRGYQPWYAYKPGTDAFKLKKKYGAKAFANWLAHSYVDRKLKLDYV
jgi:hypothetical protein